MAKPTKKKLTKRSAKKPAVKRQRKSVVDSMNANLKEKYELMKKMLVQAESKDALTRYDIGAVVFQVTTATKKYGEGAVKKLAKALGLDENTLYLWSCVPKTYATAAVKRLLARTNKFGIPLTFSHLCVLANIESDKKRSEATEAALDEGLSVRELVLKFGPGDSDVRPPATFEAGLGQFLRATETLVSRASQWKAAVFGAIEQANPDRLSDDLLQKLRNAEQANEKLEETVAENKKSIHSAIAKVEVALKKPAKAIA